MRVDSETGLVIHRGVLSRSPVAVRFLQLVNFVFGLLYAVLVTRFILEYVGASTSAGFVQFIDRISDPLYAPFKGIIRNGSDGAGHPIVWSLLVALVAYAVLHAAITGLVRALARPRVIDDDYDY